MDKIVGKLIDILEKIMTVLLGVAAILVVMQIFWRYVLRDPLGWTDQGCRFVFVWMCMFGLPVLFYRKSVVAFDLIVGKLKGKPAVIIEIVFTLIGLFFAVFFLIASVQFCIKTGPRIIPGFFNVPFNAVYGALPVSAVLLILVFADQLLLNMRAGFGKENNK